MTLRLHLLFPPILMAIISLPVIISRKRFIGCLLVTIFFSLLAIPFLSIADTLFSVLCRWVRPLIGWRLMLMLMLSWRCLALFWSEVILWAVCT